MVPQLLAWWKCVSKNVDKFANEHVVWQLFLAGVDAILPMDPELAGEHSTGLICRCGLSPVLSNATIEATKEMFATLMVDVKETQICAARRAKREADVDADEHAARARKGKGKGKAKATATPKKRGQKRPRAGTASGSNIIPGASGEDLVFGRCGSAGGAGGGGPPVPMDCVHGNANLVSLSSSSVTWRRFGSIIIRPAHFYFPWYLAVGLG